MTIKKAAAATTTIAISGGLKSIGRFDGGEWRTTKEEEVVNTAGAMAGPHCLGRWWCSGGLAAIFWCLRREKSEKGARKRGGREKTKIVAGRAED